MPNASLFVTFSRVVPDITLKWTELMWLVDRTIYGDEREILGEEVAEESAERRVYDYILSFLTVQYPGDRSGPYKPIEQLQMHMGTRKNLIYKATIDFIIESIEKKKLAQSLTPKVKNRLEEKRRELAAFLGEFKMELRKNGLPGVRYRVYRICC